MEPRMRAVSRGLSWATRRLKSGASSAVRRLRILLSLIVKGPSEGWSTFALLLLSVVLALWSVESAHRVPTPGLYSMALWSVVLGLLLSKMRFNGRLLVISGFIVGLYLSFYQLTSLAEGVTALERHAEIGTRLFMWWQSAVGGEAITDTMPFSLLLLFGSWLVGFISTWFLFRRRNVWGALLPGGSAIVASLTNIHPEEQGPHLYLYLFVAFLLVARLFSVQRNHDWDRKGIQHVAGKSGLRLPDGVWLAAVLVLVTSLLPMRPATVAPVAAAWDRVISPARVIGIELSRVLAGVPSTKPYRGHSFGPTQALGGAITLGEAPVLVIHAPFAIYLPARSYDVYMHWGWKSSDTYLLSPEWTPEQGIEADIHRWQEVEVSITSVLSAPGGEPLYLGGYPLYLSIDYELEVLQPARYWISIGEGRLDVSVEGEDLPDDLRKAMWQLHQLNSASEEPMTQAEVLSILPGDVRVISWENSDEGIEGVIVERCLSVPPDIVSVRATRPLAAGGSYQATVLVSAATESDLLAAGTEYPGWVLDRYLQLPDDIPSRVMDLSQELTRDAGTTYEKAVAVRDYLRALGYALDIEAPPDGADGVDYFLFELEKGYCQYFASAMTVLLRASGVPSRMVVGYRPGEIVEEQPSQEMTGYEPGERQAGQQMFIVGNSHSWSEAFFPQYGWIAFEPTPGYAIATRGDLVPLPPGDVEEGIDAFPGRPSAIGPFPDEADDIGPFPDEADDIGPFPDEIEDARAATPLHVWLLGMSVGLVVPGIVMWLLWRRLLGSVVEPRVAYARIGYLAALTRLGPQESFTPYEYGRRLKAALPDMSQALDRIVESYVRACYGWRDLSNEDRAQIAEAWPQVRNGLLRRALRSLIPTRFR